MMELEYGYDPLCGWCYVFGPSLRAIRARFAGQVRTRLSMGGLVVGERIKPMRAMRAYLESAMPQAEARSGVRFGEDFRNRLMADDDYAMASEPACRAVVVARSLAATEEQEVEFALSLGDAIYRQGLRSDAPTTLKAIAAHAGLDPEALLARWGTAAAAEETRREFETTRAKGISMYPTLRLHRDGVMVELLRGYATPDDAIARVARALEAAA